MKIIIPIIMMIIMSSLVLATVSRSGSGNTLTYTTTMATTYSKAYWAVDDSATSCSITSVSCSTPNADCNHVGGTIRAVGYTAESGGNMPSSIAITVSGSGSCTLNNGNYVESYLGNLGSSTALSGSITLNLATTCNTPADTNCDGCVHDSEFPIAVNNWKQQTGGITDIIFPSVVSKWKNMENCV